MTARRRGAQVEALPRRLSYTRPKGEQLQGILEGVSAARPPGALLPSERLLAERYGVARATVTQAVEGLVSRGLVYRVHGSGTFVAEPKFRQPLTLTSFTEDMRARGMTPGSVVRSQAVVPASEVVARHLALVPGSPVVHLERVRTADGEPMALERTHLPASRLPGLESAALPGASLLELLGRRRGGRVGGGAGSAPPARPPGGPSWSRPPSPTPPCTSCWSAAGASAWPTPTSGPAWSSSPTRRRPAPRSPPRALPAEAAPLLQAPPDQPALLFQRLTRDPGGTPVEYVRSLYRGDRYEVHTRLERPSRIDGAAA